MEEMDSGTLKIGTGDSSGATGGQGGDITMTVGSGNSGAGGAVAVTAGSSSAAAGGAVTVASGHLAEETREQ